MSSTDKSGNIRVEELEDELIYTIRFQNTGNFYAEDVRITDDIAINLNLATFRFIDASHEVDITIRDRELTFMFDEIFLIDSTTNFVESQGYVTFAIQPFVFDLDESFTNQASIFFDLNEPIITNTALSTVYDPTVAVSATGMERLTVAPLPADDYVSISGPDLYMGVVNYRLTDLQGKLLMTGVVDADHGSLDLSDLQSGLYLLILFDEDELMYTQKVPVVH